MDRKISGYVCTNGFMKEMMMRRGYDSRKLQVVPTFFREKPEYAVVDKAMRFDFDILRLLYIVNIDESKGIYDLVEAMEILKRRTSAFHLSIVGGLHEEENQRMLELLARKRLTGHVTFEHSVAMGGCLNITCTIISLYYLHGGRRICPILS